VHVARLLPGSIRRAFQLLALRFVALFAHTPVVFFAVVIGVALTFRVVVGAAREAAKPEVVAPTFVTGPEPGLARMGTEPTSSSSSATATTTTTANAEVGAAAKVQPLGMPSPARVAPRPRGHGRRPVR
jgi:hypothetical protein